MKKTKIQPADKKPIYKLVVQVGKKDVKEKVYKFNTNDPVKALLSINIPKMMEEVTFTLVKDGKTATRSMNSFQARRIFNNELNAFYLIKNMHFIFKQIN